MDGYDRIMDFLKINSQNWYTSRDIAEGIGELSQKSSVIYRLKNLRDIGKVLFRKYFRFYEYRYKVVKYNNLSGDYRVFCRHCQLDTGQVEYRDGKRYCKRCGNKTRD